MGSGRFGTVALMVSVLVAGTACTSPGSDRPSGAGTDDRFKLEHGPDTGGLHAFEAFNAIGLDAATYGFNELEWIDRLAPQLPKARFAMVSANVRDRGTDQVYGAQHGARPWVIKEVAGVRFGITGALTVKGPPPSVPTVEVVEPAQALAEVAPRMRAAGADVVVVVVLSHLDTHTEAQQIAGTVPGIDLILGTQDGIHSRRHNGSMAPYCPSRRGWSTTSASST